MWLAAGLKKPLATKTKPPVLTMPPGEATSVMNGEPATAAGTPLTGLTAKTPSRLVL